MMKGEQKLQPYYRGELYYQISMVHLFQGDLKKFRDNLVFSSELGYVAAVLLRGRMFGGGGDLEAAAKSFDDQWKTSENILAMIQSADPVVSNRTKFPGWCIHCLRKKVPFQTTGTANWPRFTPTFINASPSLHSC